MQSKRGEGILTLGSSMALISRITFIKLELSSVTALILNLFLTQKNGTCILAGSQQHKIRTINPYSSPTAKPNGQQLHAHTRNLIPLWDHLCHISNEQEVVWE